MKNKMRDDNLEWVGIIITLMGCIGFLIILGLSEIL